MRRLACIFTGIEAVALALYLFVLLRWVGIKQVGPLAFPGSPDWGYNYQQARLDYSWIEGLAVGILLGGVALAIAARKEVGKISRVQLAVLLALALCIALGWVVEVNTHPSGGSSLAAL